MESLWKSVDQRIFSFLNLIVENKVILFLSPIKINIINSVKGLTL